MVTKNIKYWLEEKELKTPEHDKLVIWTFNNVALVLEGLGIKDELKGCERELEHAIIKEGYSHSKYCEGSKDAIGFVDLMVISNSNKHYVFEIKPHITSIGDVMRQINYYRTYLRGKFIIVTKTKGLKELFESQGVFVYEFENGN